MIFVILSGQALALEERLATKERIFVALRGSDPEDPSLRSG
jgi:hypothetical protein